MNMLDDNLYAEASEALSRISEEFKTQVGRLPTTGEMAQILATAVQTTRTVLFSDTSNYQIKNIEWQMNKRKKAVTLKEGDAFCFPATTAKGRYIFLMYLATMRPYGDVFACYKGEHRLDVDLRTLKLHKYPFVSSNRFIDLGIWRPVGNQWALALQQEVFAEYYYNKTLYRKRDDIGPFGTAERLNRDGSTTNRNLTEDEARQIGILQNRDDLVCQPEEVEAFLRTRNWL